MTRDDQETEPTKRTGSDEAAGDWPLPVDYPNIVSFGDVLRAETAPAGEAPGAPPAEGESEPGLA